MPKRSFCVTLPRSVMKNRLVRRPAEVQALEPRIFLTTTPITVAWTSDYRTVQIQSVGGTAKTILPTTNGVPVVMGIAAVQNGGIYFVEDQVGASNVGKIMHMNNDGTNLTTVLTVTEPSSPPQISASLATLAIDPVAGKIYYVDAMSTPYSHSETINSVNLNGTNPKVLITSPYQSGIGQIALDLTHGKIYWPDNSHEVVRRANLDGSNIETIMTKVTPTAVAVDPVGGKIYVAERGNNTIDPLTDAIITASLDGTNMKRAFSTGVSSPISIAVDPADGVGFIGNLNNIGQFNLNGTGSVTNFATTYVPIGLAVLPAVKAATVTLTAPAAQSATTTVATAFKLGSLAASDATSPYTISVNWGDGVKSSFNVSAPGTLPATSHTYTTSGSYTVSLSAADAAKNASNPVSFTATVRPSIKVTPPAGQSALLGSSVNVNLGSFTQVGGVSPFKVDVNWGDGSADTIYSVTTAGTLPAKAHAFTKSGAVTVSETVTDAKGYASTKATFVETVTVVSGISGIVFADTNANGKQDGVEKGLANIKVYIDSKKTGAFATGDPYTMTTSTGAFSMTNIAAGTYVLREVLPSGYLLTAPTAGYFSVPVVVNKVSSGYAFANAPTTAKISGTVFDDANGDGKIDNGEFGVGLWTVYLDLNKNGKFDTGDKSVVTDILGGWTFTGLTAGTYVIRVVPVAGITATKPTGGVLTLTLTAAQVSAGNLFGEKANA